MKSKLGVGVVGLVCLVVGFLLGQSFQLSPQIQTQLSVGRSETEPRVSVMFDSGDGRVVSYSAVPLSNPPTVSQTLVWLRDNNKIKLEVQDYPDVGLFVKKINDKQNGQDNKYWQYWVNNTFAQIASDKFLLSNGDVVEWKFIAEQPYKN
jgi:hypothetical protein